MLTLQKAPLVTKSSNTLYIPLLSIGLISKIKWLRSITNQTVKVGILPKSNRQWIGWGNKNSSQRASTLAKLSHNSHHIQLEDGFIRSIALPKEKGPVWSLIQDPIGIYYDAYHPSSLENYISTANFDPHTLSRAKDCITTICDQEITKYNHAPTIALNLDTTKQHILVVDQTRGDLSIKAGGATEQSFEVMLKTALKNHPEAIIWVKTHPEVSAQYKQGHFSSSTTIKRVNYITAPCNPISLIKSMDAVYVVSSQMGFEALLLNKTVYCFGLPWYAGWGLTNDQFAPTHLLQQRRTRSCNLTHLFSAAYFKYTYYINPYNNQSCDLETILEIAIAQKKWNGALAGSVLCVGFSPWKKQFIRNYLNLPAIELKFESVLIHSPSVQFDHVIIWGMKQPELTANQFTPAKLWRMEDGFVRSVGLGAKLITPYSLVLDDQGIYYNPQQPSQLENCLNRISLNQSQRLRAQAAITALVQQNISKYNLNGTTDWPTHIPAGKRIILVPGQVSDDASIRYGTSPQCQTNEQLLQLVRENHPEAYIVYKPHPDVVSGLRDGSMPDDIMQQTADAIVTQTTMSICLQACDEVHTMTSLTGFEALLRQKKVYCYGQPFYSGWSLTTDLEPHPRRLKKLDLDTLVYATLISYPVYAIGQKSIGAQLEHAMTQIAIERRTPSHNRSFFTHLLPFIRRLKK